MREKHKAQISFGEDEYAHKKRRTRRERVLSRMDALIPWSLLERRLSGKYAKGLRGRKPYPLNVMLRVHVLQVMYNMSDPETEDALYDSESMRRFAGLSLSGNIPDETTILNFRHFLERHKFGRRLFDDIKGHLAGRGLRVSAGSVIDASIIEAPTSTKNKEGKRDPEMRQTKKGNEWRFGMKVHVGVDEDTGLVHSMVTTPANVHDVTQAGNLLHGGEERVWADAGYVGVEKRGEHAGRRVNWLVSKRPGVRAKMDKGSEEAKAERVKASVRAKVEHLFARIKGQFRYGKVRYRGLMKNTERLFILAGLSNLLRAEPHLPA